MAKLIWNGYVDLAEKVNSPISFITGANIRKKKMKKPVKKKPVRKP